jgi:signal transduction histidine kinase
MLVRLEDAFERQKRFIADASHEMRTPLTIIKGDIEVALHRPRTAAEYRETLEMVGETTDRLTTLVQELFLLARADNNQYPLQVERFDLVELLAKQVASLKAQALKKDISLEFQAPTSLSIEADLDKLARLFLNLIDNGIKYSGCGATVTVAAQAQAGQARVTVVDTGPGIAPEYLPHLFDRFYRVDKARARGNSNASSSGAGLGLSIAQWLAQAHGGRIEVSSQVGRGTTFTVWLPLQQALRPL